MIEIDLGKHSSPADMALIGRSKGKVIREELKRQIDLDSNPSEIIGVIVPQGIVSVNSSFFLGLFGESVRKLGSENFRRKFRFECSGPARLNIERGIEEALIYADPEARAA